MATAANAEHIGLIQLAIASSTELRKQIVKYLNNLIIPVDHLELLRDLFRIYNPTLLFNLDKTQYLISTLSRHEKRSYEFYTTWFTCFLCDEYYVQTGQESKEYHQLLKEWSNKFRYDRDILEKVSMKMDTLLEKLTAVVKTEKKDQRLIYCIKHIIDIYFQQSKDNIFFIKTILEYAIL